MNRLEKVLYTARVHTMGSRVSMAGGCRTPKFKTFREDIFMNAGSLKQILAAEKSLRRVEKGD